MKPVPFVYTTDMRRSLDWYRRVIPSATLRADGPYWSELDIEGHTLAFHAAESLSQGGAAGITFVASEALERLLERPAEHGIEPARGDSRLRGTPGHPGRAIRTFPRSRGP